MSCLSLPKIFYIDTIIAFCVYIFFLPSTQRLAYLPSSHLRYFRDISTWAHTGLHPFLLAAEHSPRVFPILTPCTDHRLFISCQTLREFRCFCSHNNAASYLPVHRPLISWVNINPKKQQLIFTTTCVNLNPHHLSHTLYRHFPFPGFHLIGSDAQMPPRNTGNKKSTIL